MTRTKVPARTPTPLKPTAPDLSQPSPQIEPDAAPPRPVGIVQPGFDRARRAQKALAENRLDDARDNLEALADSESLEGAWKALLSGRVLLAAKDFSGAAARFRHAVATCAIVSASLESSDASAGPLSSIDPTATFGNNADWPRPDTARIAALALEELGAIHRRQDRPNDALRSHFAACRLREQHGSFEELCETAIHLGIDSELARQLADAEAWFRRAIELAGRTTENPRRHEARAWQRLAHCLSLAGKHAEATTAARSARSAWQRHDPSSLDATRSDLHLGRILLKFGESLFDADAPRARTLLDDAATTLTSAADGLQAFGPAALSDAESAAQQADFARRLHASLSV